MRYTCQTRMKFIPFEDHLFTLVNSNVTHRTNHAANNGLAKMPTQWNETMARKRPSTESSKIANHVNYFFIDFRFFFLQTFLCCYKCVWEKYGVKTTHSTLQQTFIYTGILLNHLLQFKRKKMETENERKMLDSNRFACCCSWWWFFFFSFIFAMCWKSFPITSLSLIMFNERNFLLLLSKRKI